MKARIYEIKNSAATNAEVLRDEENDRFYWNDEKFKDFSVGDRIFFVNTHAGWALYTTIGEKDIVTTHANGKASFSHAGHDYSVDDATGRYGKFVRFDVQQESLIGKDDEWTSLGSSEVNDLWRNGQDVDTSTSRMERIDQLKRIFRDGEGYNALVEIQTALTGGSAAGTGLVPAIVNALRSKGVQALLSEPEFHLKRAQAKLKEFEELQGSAEHFQALAARYQEREGKPFVEILQEFGVGTPERATMTLVAELIAHCDEQAAGKKEFNSYPDKRVVARTSVRQSKWVNNLLAYKASGNDWSAVTAPSIRNAVAYLKDPIGDAPITSDEHRAFIAEHLVKKPYVASTFVSDLKQFFAPYGINPAVPENLTRIITHVLYKDRKVVELWYGISGLLASDGGDWFDAEIEEFKKNTGIVLWWSKRPSGGQKTLVELNEALRRDGSFTLYWGYGGQVHHRARIIAFKTDEDYASHTWDKNMVAGLRDSADEYRSMRNGKEQKARIIFMAEAFEKLEPTIPIERFTMRSGFEFPTQDNLQPFVEVKDEPGWEGEARMEKDEFMARARFRAHLVKTVQPSTADQYLGMMPRVQAWLIANHAIGNGFNIWRDTDQNQAIDEVLDTKLRDQWNELNREKRNWYSATWNNWKKFLAHEPPDAIETTMATKSDLEFTNEHRAILCAIKTKPFILLAGISGTGKSRMVRTLAYQTCAVPELHGDRPGNYALIMVKPNWHDPTELIGYVSRIDSQPKYVVTEFLRFLVKAWRYPQVPFFLCLDEMNLAPVEQYFADYLSVVETRRVKGGKVISDAILSKANMDEPSVFENALAKLGLDDAPELKAQFLRDGITLPPNLVVMGTVNMDETTHSFSRKVLDRAMTFEMNQVDLRSGLEKDDTQWDYADPALASSLVLGELTRGGQVPENFAKRNDVLQWLERLNGILEGTPFKVAYRVRDEFLMYTYHNSLLGAKPGDWLERCLDELLVMKVLSRIEGDENRVGQVLKDLQGLVPDTWTQSTKKLKEMQHKLTFGYTSFWS